jgi:hypothetical protein
MQPNPHDETADRAAEERSEDDGMSEHRAKAGDPARWAAERRARTRRRAPPAERGSGRAGVFSMAMVSCAALAALAFARGAFRRVGAGVGAGAKAATSPGRPTR